MKYGINTRPVLKRASTTPSRRRRATPSSMKGKFLAAALQRCSFFPFIDEGVDCEARRGSRNNFPSLSSGIMKGKSLTAAFQKMEGARTMRRGGWYSRPPTAGMPLPHRHCHLC